MNWKCNGTQYYTGLLLIATHSITVFRIHLFFTYKKELGMQWDMVLHQFRTDS